MILIFDLIIAMSQKPTRNPEKGRGIGHVTLRIFGLPSDVSPKPVNKSANHCLKFCKLH